jgi:serine protein kinase
MEAASVTSILGALGDRIRDDFAQARRVLSFAEYLREVAAAPARHLRTSAQYIVDAMDHFGTAEVRYPWGTATRFRIFDAPWATSGADPSSDVTLFGQEAAQAHVYRQLRTFVQDGSPRRVLLLHGPNGSAKSTFIRCLGRGLEHYSTLPEGALYRFVWIFPSQRSTKGGIGFGGDARAASDAAETFAHLPDDAIDARVVDDLRDHPLLLVPPAERGPLIDGMLAAVGAAAPASGAFIVGDYLRHGTLSPKNRTIFEALLASYHGDYLRVLRHVQVQRFDIAQRYRTGWVTVEPQLSVDATERQLTADRSITALPPSLQSVALFEYGGDVVGANRGFIEYDDLLKRPLEHYKYLLTTVERGALAMSSATLPLDLCFVGSCNEIHLTAFREIPDFPSFRGRLELVRVPYIRDVGHETALYAARLRESAGGRHVAPHTAYVAALWAVMTRMRKPDASKYPSALAPIVDALTPRAKAELYATGRTPPDLAADRARELGLAIGRLWHEFDDDAAYEGRIGASPRELLAVLHTAIDRAQGGHVSPLVVLEEIAELCRQTSLYEFLRIEPLPGGFHDVDAMLAATRAALLDRVDEEVRAALGLVEEREHTRLFDRYVQHVTHYLRKEKVRNPTTGALDEPDAGMMREVERTLEITAGGADAFRQGLIAKIGAWSIDHKGERPVPTEIFADLVRKLRDAYYDKQKDLVRRGAGELLRRLTDHEAELSAEAAARAEAAEQRLIEHHGYQRASARELVSALVGDRYRG